DKKHQASAGGPPVVAPLQVEAQVLKASSISEKLEVTGNILPFESTEIKPEISGRVVYLNIKEGAMVSKGQLLVKLFDGDLQAQLKRLKVQLQIAEKTEERQKELIKIGGISQQDYDLSLLQLNNIRADMELISVNITKTEIRAPYSGKLGLKNISPGAYISPNNILTTINQVDQLKIEFSIPEKYSSQIKNGMEINFSVEGSPGLYKAAISATESSVEQNTRNLKIRAIVKSGDRYLIPGNFAKVEIILGKNENAIMIPTQSVIPIARGKQVVTLKDGQVVFKPVITGVRDSSSVQVIDGLSIGDTLITTGLLFIRPGSKIKLTKIQ
ncbi:MAG: efflux RND transporter periplasmic adaptor subunit, partial [Chitinophagaceae bacterium]